MKRRFDKYRALKRVVCIVAICGTVLCSFGCNKIEKEDTISLVAGKIEVVDEGGDVSYHIVINEDGTVTAFGNPHEVYDFDEWNNIVSITVGGVNAGGIRADGTVVVTGATELGAMDVGDWRDIVMIEFTIFSAYGLKSNRTIVSTGAKHMDEMPDFEKKIIEEVATWRNIVNIDTADFTVVGTEASGRVKVATDLDVEFIERTADWRNIKQVSVSDHMLAGLTYHGEVLVAHDGWTKLSGSRVQKTGDGWVELPPRPVSLIVNHLEGAIKICAGDSFVAGLMSDGTLKTCEGGGVLAIAEDVLALDGTENVADINSHGDTLVVLNNDGTVIVAGRDD